MSRPARAARRVPSRRTVLAALAALPALPAFAQREVRELTWDDLVPGGADAWRQTMQDLGLHDLGAAAGVFEQPKVGDVVRALDGRRVRLPGYIVPLAFEGLGTTEFLLVPYVGACIHVPPPPPNQIVLVESATPYEIEGYFDAVEVTGTMRVATVDTELAQVGYALTAETVARYEG